MDEFSDRITAYAKRRLLTNRREFRLVQSDGLFCVGWLARAVNLGLIDVVHTRMTEAAIDQARTEVVPLNLSDQVGRFAPLTLQSPCLAYARPDGSTIVIDGLNVPSSIFEMVNGMSMSPSSPSIALRRSG